MSPQNTAFLPLLRPSPDRRFRQRLKWRLEHPCIRGKRITVEILLGQLGDGVSIEELLADYPNLEREDILEALRYGAWLTSGYEVDLAVAS